MEINAAIEIYEILIDIDAWQIFRDQNIKLQSAFEQIESNYETSKNECIKTFASTAEMFINGSYNKQFEIYNHYIEAMRIYKISYCDIWESYTEALARSGKNERRIEIYKTKLAHKLAINIKNIERQIQKKQTDTLYSS